ncbi:hypothetical protein [[Clostridium] fimetarium]|uniref:Uncharacterized protein n=1 Tax=[Clostridium] fimetarium TaxID=99656 RepID=A0A1I0R6X5_9FIRM|nr:hypothetical protein [[Clostridium] fimetarium]SEW36265.1 hypothetical protein SAMN05421659_11275 [[Clostridium] fimetarium]
MGKFNGVEKLGLRNKETGKLIAVYPNKAEGTDEEISKTVKDWYYKKNCSAEDELLSAYVDLLTEHELKEHQ